MTAAAVAAADGEAAVGCASVDPPSIDGDGNAEGPAAAAAEAAGKGTGGAALSSPALSESSEQPQLSPPPLRQQQEEQQQEQQEDEGGLMLSRFPLELSAAYDASSPDELALTAAAKHLGAEFICRPNLNTIQLAVRSDFAAEALLSEADRATVRTLMDTYQQQQQQQQGKGEQPEQQSTEQQQQQQQEAGVVPVVNIELLEGLEFDNYRKRMSVVVRDRDGQLRLLMKGADTSVFAAAAAGQEEAIASCKVQLSEMAQRGLRTLVLGQRFVTPKQFKKYQESSHAN